MAPTILFSKKRTNFFFLKSSLCNYYCQGSDCFSSLNCPLLSETKTLTHFSQSCNQKQIHFEAFCGKKQNDNKKTKRLSNRQAFQKQLCKQAGWHELILPATYNHRVKFYFLPIISWAWIAREPSCYRSVLQQLT